MKIAFFDSKKYDKTSFESFNNKNDLSFKYISSILNEDTVELAKGYDAICAFVNDDLNKTVIDKLCEFGVKLVALRCAGFNNVDIEAAQGKIAVVRVPAYSPYAVAEHAMALLLCVARRINTAYNRTRDFNFNLVGLEGFELHGKTIGIIGTGKIGRIFADICKGFGMKILAYDKYPTEMEDVEYTSIDNLFKESDIISLHCPLTDETRHIVNKENLSKAKTGVVLINTSRGALVDAEALLEGIKERKVKAACLDVYEEEAGVFFGDRSSHIMDDDTLARLMTMPNVIITSHQAFLTNEALANIAETTVNNILSFFNEGKTENSIY